MWQLLTRRLLSGDGPRTAFPALQVGYGFAPEPLTEERLALRCLVHSARAFNPKV